jgi:hypothetical protein
LGAWWGIREPSGAQKLPADLLAALVGFLATSEVSVLPKTLESTGRQFRVAHGVLDASVSKISLQ